MKFANKLLQVACFNKLIETYIFRFDQLFHIKK